jgi:NinB protein
MSRALLVIEGPVSRRKAATWVQNAPIGTQVEFKKARRSLDQNSKLWAMLTDIAHQVDWYGEKLSAEDWKDVLTASLRRARVVPGIDAGTFVPLGMRTSDMTKQEFSDLLELAHAFAAERGVKLGDDEKECAT